VGVVGGAGGRPAHEPVPKLRCHCQTRGTGRIDAMAVQLGWCRAHHWIMNHSACSGLGSMWSSSMMTSVQLLAAAFTRICPKDPVITNRYTLSGHSSSSRCTMELSPKIMRITLAWPYTATPSDSTIYRTHLASEAHAQLHVWHSVASHHLDQVQRRLARRREDAGHAVAFGLAGRVRVERDEVRQQDEAGDEGGLEQDGVARVDCAV
jgi:hypothetical protein